MSTLTGAAEPHKKTDPAVESLFESGWLLPSARQFAGLFNQFSRVYSSRFDEAIRHYAENARAMSNDTFLTALLMERTRPLCGWKWEVALDEDNPKGSKEDPAAEEIRRQLEGLIRRTKRFHEMREYLSTYVWQGRYGSQVLYGWDTVGGYRRRVVVAHEPVDGDNILPTFDGYPALAVHTGDASDYAKRYGEDTVTYSDRFSVFKLNRPDLRQRFIIQRHHIRAGDFFWPETGGRIGGIGLRHQVYWTWWLRQQMLESMVSFMDKVGQLGLLIFYYEEGNTTSENKAKQAAIDAGKRSALAVPVPKGKDPKTAGVELIPANMNGVQFLVDFVERYFERHIERLFVGQAASASSEGDSLGGNSSDFQKDTKYNLLRCDAEATMCGFTEDLLHPLQHQNFPGIPWRYNFRFVLPDPEAAKKLDAATKAFSMGVSFDEDEVRGLTGMSKPNADSPNVLKQQQGPPGGMPGMPPPGGEQPPEVGQGAGPMPPDGSPTGEAQPHGQPVQGMGELVAAMIQAAADGDTEAVNTLAELGSDPEALAGFLGDDDAGGADQAGQVTDPRNYNSFAGVVDYQWTAASTKGGGTKAVWQGEGSRRPLYGDAAKRALANQGKQDRGEPTPQTPQQKAQELKQQREPGREKARQAWQRAIADPASIRPDELTGLADQLNRLTRDELRGMAREMSQRVGGLKMDLVQRLREYAASQGAGVATPATESNSGSIAVDENVLQSHQMLRQWGDRWQWRINPDSRWMTSDSKSGAIEQAAKMYAQLPDSQKMTASERGALADQKEYDDLHSIYGNRSLDELQKIKERADRTKGVGFDKEFGDGKRSYGAAMANQGARDAKELSMKLGRYIERRKRSGQAKEAPATSAPTPDVGKATPDTGGKGAAQPHNSLDTARGNVTTPAKEEGPPVTPTTPPNPVGDTANEKPQAAEQGSPGKQVTTTTKAGDSSFIDEVADVYSNLVSPDVTEEMVIEVTERLKAIKDKNTLREIGNKIDVEFHPRDTAAKMAERISNRLLNVKRQHIRSTIFQTPRRDPSPLQVEKDLQEWGESIKRQKEMIAKFKQKLYGNSPPDGPGAAEPQPNPVGDTAALPANNPPQSTANAVDTNRERGNISPVANQSETPKQGGGKMDVANWKEGDAVPEGYQVVHRVVEKFGPDGRGGVRDFARVAQLVPTKDTAQKLWNEKAKKWAMQVNPQHPYGSTYENLPQTYTDADDHELPTDITDIGDGVYKVKKGHDVDLYRKTPEGGYQRLGTHINVNVWDGNQPAASIPQKKEPAPVKAQAAKVAMPEGFRSQPPQGFAIVSGQVSGPIMLKNQDTGLRVVAESGKFRVQALNGRTLSSHDNIADALKEATQQ